HAHGDRLAALRVLAELARLRDFLARHVLLDVVDQRDEWLPEFLQRLGPVFFAARHRVELVFERRGEAVLHVLVEVLGKETVDDLADVRRDEPAIVHVDVLAILERRDDGGVGGRATDAVFFQRLDQRGFGVTRWRLGEVLVALDFYQGDHVAVLHGRQDAIALVLRLSVVGVFLVDGDVAGLDQRGTVGAQRGPGRGARLGPGAGLHVHGDGVEQRVRHLRGHGALPDQRVQLELVGIDLAFDPRRQDGRGGRADGFVRFLRIARLGL